MGEIGMMVSRLHQEGFDLEHMIDEELRAAGFMELCERTTRTLLQRAAAVEESHASLRRLLDSIDSQLKDYQEAVKLSSSVEIDDTTDDPPVSRNHSEKEDRSPKTVIIIDDDEKEYVDVADMSCQATSMDIQNETCSSHEKASAVPLPARTPPSEKQSDPSVPEQQSTSTEILQSYVPIQPAPDKDTPQKPELHFSGLSTMRFSAPSQPVSKPSDVVVSSVSSVTKAPPVIYRTLKPPVASGAPSMTHRVNPLSKSPEQPVPPMVPITTKTSTTNGASLLPGSQESRSNENSTPSLAQPVAKATYPAEMHVASADTCTHKNTLTLDKSVDVGPPKFDIGTRVIGQRADGLWYPGVIEKLLTDKQKQPKYRVKFDKGTRGLLSSNHISLESNPDPSVLDVGSRVVALRPRDTAEENASWRKPSTGVYGKLDVLYAGIIAEKACAENKSRFLVFFDDGFAQYLPVKKLHHVYHTGKKVWDEVADHSKEFIQEYLEEFPNRPMVKLRVNQWVKTEWRGQWLKAKVMQIDCSLIKMLFQIDNRSEWLYRGSTRLEPLYSALVNGKISTAKKKRSRKLTRGSVGKGSEPYIDYSITKPCFGVSPYSKTDPKGEEQQRQEEKRQQTQLEQLRQQEQQEERRDKGKQKSTPETSTTATSVTSPVTTSNSSVTGSSTSTVSPAGFSTASTTTDSATGNPLPQSDVLSSTISSQVTPQMRPDNGTASQLSGNCNHGDSGAAPNTKPSPPGCGSSSSLSVIQASTARKKTYANRMSENNVIGLQGVTSNPSLVEVNLIDRSQTPQGIEVIELDGDAGTGVLRVPVEADDMMNCPLTLRKSEYLVPNMDGSLLDEFYHGWEAPWLRVNRRDIRSTGLNRAPAFQIPTNDRRKQDVASLIQERLMQNKLLTKLDDQSIATQIPVVKSKSSVKGPHKCGPHCIPQESLPGEEVMKLNPRAIPLLLKWKREIAQRHPGHKKTVYYRTPCNKRLRSLAETANYLTVTGATNVSIDQFTFDPQISCQNTVFNGVEPIIPDISRGTDAIEISVVNEVDTCYPPPIDYVSKRVLADGVNMVLDPGFLACCDCTDNCQDKTKCSCAQLTIQATAAVGGKEDNNAGYEFRLLKDCIQTGIYECNQNCACGSQCFNRVVQNGIQLRLQVFKTENRGWGLRSLDDIPMGTFVCTYAGQILNEDMANKEGRDFGDEYLAELDHIEVVEKAKEGYESSVSDLEEDDSVIYKTLAGESSTTASASEDSDASSLSGNDSSEADSLFSDDSYSSERNSRHGDGSNINHKRKRRRRSLRNSPKRKRGLAGEESLMVERESKAYCLSNLADEKWCYIALKRNHDNRKEAAVFLNKMLKGEGTEASDVVHIEPGASAVDEEEKNVQSSDFDFDDVGETFYQDMKVITSESKTINEATGESSRSEDANTDGNKTKENVKANSVDIIDLTSDNEETESVTERVGKGSNFSSNPAANCTHSEQRVELEKFDSEHFVKGEKHEKRVEDGESTDSAPSLLSAEDLSKLAAQNPNLTDEPPILTKMNPARRMTNPLGDTISRLMCRVSTGPLSADEEVSMDLDPLAVESAVDREPTEKSVTTETSISLRTDHLSEPSSPEMEYVESLPPSPSSLRSDISKSESVDMRSELSTGSSRRSVRVSKPLPKKDKVKPKIHYSRSLPKQTNGSPTTKLSSTIPSPSGPSLSRQSSVNSKRLSTRLMFGEEHCYVIDAKAYGNCGRYLNHSCSPNLFVQNVFVDTHDLRFPWVAFFTQQNVSAGTELTWDYAYEVGSVKDKVLHCYCGSAECRGRLL